MTNISQKPSINILKPLIFSADKVSLSCVLIGQNLISNNFRVFFKFTKVNFTFCHSVMSFHFVKQCCIKNTASGSSLSKLNWDVLNLTTLKHTILFLQCKLYTGEIL